MNLMLVNEFELDREKSGTTVVPDVGLTRTVAVNLDELISLEFHGEFEKPVDESQLPKDHQWHGEFGAADAQKTMVKVYRLRTAKYDFWIDSQSAAKILNTIDSTTASLTTWHRA